MAFHFIDSDTFNCYRRCRKKDNYIGFLGLEFWTGRGQLPRHGVLNRKWFSVHSLASSPQPLALSPLVMKSWIRFWAWKLLLFSANWLAKWLFCSRLYMCVLQCVGVGVCVFVILGPQSWSWVLDGNCMACFECWLPRSIFPKYL